MGQEASGIRINKYLSEVGHCSRRAADKLLEQGRITLNGVVPELGTKVMPGDTVEVATATIRKHEINEGFLVTSLLQLLLHHK